MLNIEAGHTWHERTYQISEDGGLIWGTEESVNDGDTSFSFSLQDGWMARVNELPFGEYTISETADDTYTAMLAQQTVTIDDANSGDGVKVDFTNVKKTPTPATVSLEAQNTVDGEAPETVIVGYAAGVFNTVPFADAFSFKLSQTGTSPVGAVVLTNTTQTVTNDAHGTVTFDEIGNLNAVGDYTFQVVELSADTAYVDADGSTYTAVVRVAYNAKANSGNLDYNETPDQTPNSLYVSSINWTKNGVAAASAVFDNHNLCEISIARPSSPFIYTLTFNTNGGTENPFSDVKDGAYYDKAVLWAVEKGITNGDTATTFAPDKTCTRAQIVTFLYRQLGYCI